MYIKKLKGSTVKCPDSWHSDLSMLSIKAKGILYYISVVIPEGCPDRLETVLTKNNKIK